MGAYTQAELAELEPIPWGLRSAVLGATAWGLPMAFALPLPFSGALFVAAGLAAACCALAAVALGVVAVARRPEQFAGWSGLVLGLSMIVLLGSGAYLVSLMP